MPFVGHYIDDQQLRNMPASSNPRRQWQRQYSSFVCVTLLVMFVSFLCGETTKSGIADGIFGRWLPSKRFKIELVRTSLIDNVVSVVTIDDSEVVSVSNIHSVNDVNVRLQLMPVFIRGVIMKYSFRNAESAASTDLNSYDNAYPYTLSVGRTYDVQTLQPAGQHEITITVVGWFGIHLSSSRR